MQGVKYFEDKEIKCISTQAYIKSLNLFVFIPYSSWLFITSTVKMQSQKLLFDWMKFSFNLMPIAHIPHLSLSAL